MINFKFDKASYDKKVRQFAALQRRNIGEAIRDETRLALVECAERTPPFNGGKLKGGGLTQGNIAVTRDVKRVFRDPRNMALYETNSGFRYAADHGDVELMKRYLTKARNYDGVERLPRKEEHRKNRDARGRVSKGRHWQAITSQSGIELFIAAALERVGWARSGWNAASRKFGAIIPAWVARHHAPGTVSDLTQNTDTPIAECANTLNWIQEAGRRLKIVEFALKARQLNLIGKIRRETSRSFLESNKAK